MTVAVFRKVSALIIAATLFISTSLSAFAANDLFFHPFPYFSEVNISSKDFFFVSDDIYKFTDSSARFPLDGALLAYDTTLNSATFDSYVVFSLVNKPFSFHDDIWDFDYYPEGVNTGFYTTSFTFRSSAPLPDDFNVLLYPYFAGSELINIPNIDFSFSSSRVFDSGYYYNQILISYNIPFYYELGNFALQFNIENIGIHRDVTHVSVSNSFYPYSEADYSLFSMIRSGFDSLLSFFSGISDKDENNYQAVTDPSTSQEIQDTQDMIDNVEDFEASLNQNITTEFNKIDFTTPTNLAAPVAFVADKVTRSVNSLGSGYQPLIFVPLTLGIMLIMLGRGVTALGSMVGRSSAAKRSDGGDE